jgi:hypothetical protein
VFEGQLFSFASSFFCSYCKLVQEKLEKEISALITAAAASNAQSLACWNPSEIIKVLRTQRTMLEDSLPFESLCEQVLRQATYYIGGRFLNILLDTEAKLCTCGNGMGIKMLAVQLDEFMDESIPWRSVQCKQNIMLARQAADVLLVNKGSLAQEPVRADVCPLLSLEQVTELLVAYTPDEFDTEPVHPGVISNIRALIAQQHPKTGPLFVPVAQQKVVVQVDLSAGRELETHFTAASACDFAATDIPATVLRRPGFAFLKAVCTDDSPWA